MLQVKVCFIPPSPRLFSPLGNYLGFYVSCFVLLFLSEPFDSRNGSAKCRGPLPLPLILWVFFLSFLYWICFLFKVPECKMSPPVSRPPRASGTRFYPPPSPPLPTVLTLICQCRIPLFPPLVVPFPPSSCSFGSTIHRKVNFSFPRLF